MGELTLRVLPSVAKRAGRHADGEGLFLRVVDAERRFWTYRFRLAGRESELSLGPYPKVGLDEARRLHAVARAKVVNGVDPRAEKKSASAARKAAQAEPTGDPAKPTFGEIADDYLERQERRGQLGKHAKHRQQWRNSLRGLPGSFRGLPVDRIGPQQIFDALDPIWDQKPESAARLRGRIATVLDFARDPEDVRPNPAAWSGWLKTKLGNPKKLGKLDRKTGERVARSNYAALPYADLPAFIARLIATPGMASLALQWLILTCARTNETLGARWSEVDLAAALWTIPAARMKSGRTHSVPLSDRALAILKQARDEAKRQPESEAFLFPGQRLRRPLNNTTFLLALKRKGIAATVHGFRSTFRDWAGDKTSFPREIAEGALAHAVGDSTERAYRRSDALEKRRDLMNAWSQFLR
jgi:integrase